MPVLTRSANELDLDLTHLAIELAQTKERLAQEIADRRRLK